MTQSPIVELQPRGGRRHGGWAGRRLAIVDGLMSEPALNAYHLLPSVRGDLLVKLGRPAEAGRNSSAPPPWTRNAR